MKYVITFFFLCIFIQVYSQSEKSRKISINERVIVNTDRKIYIAGENLFFSFYLLDTQTNGLAAYHSFGYVILKNTSGDIVGKSQVKVINGKASGTIYLSDTLKTAYYQIVAFTNFMRNAPEELFAKNQVMIANRFDNEFFGLISNKNSENDSSNMLIENFLNESSPLKIVPDKLQYAKREKVVVKFNLTSTDIQFVDFTISVSEKNQVDQNAISFEKKAREEIRYFLDFSTNSRKMVHLSENKFQELTGRLTDSKTGYPLGYYVLYLSSPDSVANFEYAITNANGYFRFPLSDYYSGKDIFIKVKERLGESITANIEVDSKFENSASFLPEHWTLDSSMIAYLKNSQDLVKVQKSFNQIRVQLESDASQTRIPYLFKVPDFTVYPSDYIELKDFVEISREIIPALKLRKVGNEYYSEVLDISHKRFLNDDPVFFLDGIIIDNVSQLIPFGTKDIKKIDMISTSWIVDHQEFHGIVSVYSNNNLWKNVNLNSNNRRVKVESFYKMPKLLNPDYSLGYKNSREPDFRQLLYWNPSFQLNANKTQNIEFYTSDYTGSYLIKISGITDKGERISAFREIQVQD